ncbi:hypothetical protein E4U17_007173 [Claviceps sp. LM77 group G4]|nr:hypothetical protein E4U17_007173 [Claviceps sp. LM77 group G4]KAG6066241.1 hypothetical protein E4U33_005635 [Claviceps sp. LM78 group G4]
MYAGKSNNADSATIDPAALSSPGELLLHPLLAKAVRSHRGKTLHRLRVCLLERPDLSRKLDFAFDSSTVACRPIWRKRAFKVCVDRVVDPGFHDSRIQFDASRSEAESTLGLPDYSAAP